MEQPLSVQSALSVKEAAIAIRYHGVRYLPVVDDGRLVGIVAFREDRRHLRCDPDLGQWRKAATASRALLGRKSGLVAQEDR